VRPISLRGKSRISVDGLAVPIDVEDGHGILFPLCAFLPQRSGPTGENFCERSIRSNRGQLCQKSLGVAVAVGEASTGQQCQSLTGVAKPRPMSVGVPRLAERAALSPDGAGSQVADARDAAMEQQRTGSV
jgi:hypothetical protein